VAVNYAVQAEVIDIQSDRPQASDAILIDSNVWFWMTYFGSGLGSNWRARVYPGYVRAARKAKAKLLRCGLSMAELAHGIEQAEFDIFAQTHPNEKLKDFRHNYAVERTSVTTSVQAAWRIVKSMAAPLPLGIDERTTNAAIVRLQTQLLDAYDLFMVEAMTGSGVTQVLTDDGDYCTVPGIQVFTANRQVIDAARSSGKLRSRQP
jgi:hypothetical protein